MNHVDDAAVERDAKLAPVEAASRPARASFKPDLALVQKSISPAAFFLVFAVYALWLGDTFLNSRTLILNVHQNVPILLLGLSVLVTLVVGQFDLSVASTATLTNVLTIGLASQQGWSIWPLIGFCLLIGGIAGLVNGFLVVGLKVNAFIATLGSGGILLGLSHVYSEGTTVTPTVDGPQLPEWFTGPGSIGDVNSHPSGWLTALLLGAVLIAVCARWRTPGVPGARRRDAIIALVALAAIAVALALGITTILTGTTWTILLVFAVATILWALIEHTVYGRNLRATGSNKTAARLAGVPIRMQTITAFVLGGVIAAFAGVVFASIQGSAPVDSAVGFLLPGFAAAFLSTVIFSSGSFTVWGTVLGGTFLSWVALGLVLGGLAFTWTAVVNGVVLLVAVSISTFRSRWHG